MKNNFSDIFTQGGQTQLHKFHMMRQVVGTTMRIGLWIWLVVFIVLVVLEHHWHDFWFILCHWKAYVRMVYFKMLPKDFWDSCWLLVKKTGKWSEFSDTWLAFDVQVIVLARTLVSEVLTNLMQALAVAIMSVTALIFYWYKRGLRNQQTKVVSGASIVTPRQLTSMIKKEKAHSSITLAGVPYIKDSEAEHTLIVGTTGSGKTNAMNELLLQIRKQNGKAVIVDTHGTFVERFFDSSQDTLLNPFDARSDSWNLWKECYAEHMFDHFASCLIPTHNVDPFWTQAARTVFTVAAMRLQESDAMHHKNLIGILLVEDLKKVQHYFEKSIASSLMDPSSEKLAQSVRATLTNPLKGLSFVEDEWDKSFAIRQWMTDSEQKGFLFLTSSPDHRATMTPLLTGWFSLAAKALMSEITGQKVWFFMDEMSSLSQIPDLSQLLAEIRKYGGCFVLGLQNLSQLDNLYGSHETRVICGLTGTKLIFRTTDTETAKRMSAFLGEQEVLEQSESISFGAHQMRDGVNLAPHKTHKPLVPFSDLMNLSNLVAYFRLPRNLPLTMITFDYHALPIQNLAFVRKAQSNQSTYTRPNRKSSNSSSKSALSDEQEGVNLSGESKNKECNRNPY